MLNLKNIVIGLGVLFSTLSAAQDGSTFYSYCQQYNAYPRQCIQVGGCFYSNIYSLCLASDGSDVPGPVGPIDYCSQYNGSRMQCAAMACYYDNRSGICYGPMPH